MSPEQINIAIAESLGWEFVREGQSVERNYCLGCVTWVAIHPNGVRYEWRKGYDEIEYLTKFACSDRVPNYQSSLDACAEFEAKLTLEHGKTYVGLFDEVCGGELCLSDMADSPQEYLFWCVRATPLQKCEAYLRTIGKWTTSTQQPT